VGDFSRFRHGNDDPVINELHRATFHRRYRDTPASPGFMPRRLISAFVTGRNDSSAAPGTPRAPVFSDQPQPWEGTPRVPAAFIGARIEDWIMATKRAEHNEVLTPVEARQGLVSGRVVLVLAASLTLVVAVFAAIYVWGI
jgi:hypothetical protein